MRVSQALRIGPEDRVTLFASFGTGQARTVMYRALLTFPTDASCSSAEPIPE
jgi:hypothetical protein